MKPLSANKSDAIDQKSNRSPVRVVLIVLITIAVILIANSILRKLLNADLFKFIKDLFMLKYLPQLNSNVSFGLIFIFGLLTSFHCVGMCGGVVISQTAGKANGETKTVPSQLLVPSTLYNFGRVAAYTFVGGVVGGLGQVIAFSGVWKGIVPIFGGLFMIVMAINLLGVFPFFRYINFRLPGFIARKLYSSTNAGEGSKCYGPLAAGLLTGLMPCGPLQMMQIYALGTGSIIHGAASMFFFSIGTIPLLFLFGLINTMISKKHTEVILKTSAAIVLVLGIIMIGRGLALAGMDFQIPFFAADEIKSQQSVAVLKDGIQVVDTSLAPDAFPSIVVQKGIKVRWNIHADKEDLNGCNNAIVIPKLKIEKGLEEGDNYIEFISEESGVIPYTCWMGMIKSKITVLDDLEKVSESVSADTSGQSNTAVLGGTSTGGSINGTTGEETAGIEATPGGKDSQSGHTIETWTGWIIDRDCVGADTIKHSKNCSLTGAGKTPPDSCYASGLGLVVYVPEKTAADYKSNVYPDYLIFDGESREIARNFLYSLPSDWSENLTVKVKGSMVDDIPTNADETHVPETDMSKVAKHLTGIHIISIETTLIEGVSTNTLPTPNLVVTADTLRVSVPSGSAVNMTMDHTSR